MASVFVSYAREDAAKARAIASALEHASLELWFDERIPSGSEFSRAIEEALARSSAVLVLWSKDSVESAWVRDEAAEGRDSGRLVSVLLDGCRPPIGFRQFQSTDLSHWSGRGRPKQLADVIAAIHAKAGTPVAERTESVTASPARGRRRIAWAAALLTLILGAGAALFLGNQTKDRTAATLSVGLLPFVADSSDPDARRLASAAHESVAHTLSQGAFAVRTMDSAPRSGPMPDFLISGQLTGTPEKFVATVRMEETARHIVVFSHQFEAARDKAADFPEMIGAQVASQLSWTAPMIAVERRHPSDPAVIAGLLQSSTAGLDNFGTLRDFEVARRLAAQAPNSPLAQDTFAINTAFALDQIPRGERARAVAAARRAAERTIRLAPEFGGGYIPWCLLHSEQRMVECEDRLRTAMRVDPDSAFENWFLSRLLNNVGRNREATELASLSLAHDQYMPYKIAHMLRMLESGGRTDEAAELYRRSTRWWPGSELISWFRSEGMMVRGDFEALRRFEAENAGAGEPSRVLAAINQRSAGRLRAACSGAQDFDATLCMLGFARLGDLDAAYAQAERAYPSRRGRTPEDEERIWLDNPGAMPLFFLTGPVAAPLRRDARYLPLAERVGLLEYWRSGRAPDFCRDRPEPICPRLLRRR